MGQNMQRRKIDSGRLDSWKEIAAFFHRDARTVRRWEADRQLPVHRVPGGERSGVFAYVDELEAWLRNPNTRPEQYPEIVASRKIAVVSRTAQATVAEENAREEDSKISADEAKPAAVSAVQSDTQSTTGSTVELTADPATPLLSTVHSLNTLTGSFEGIFQPHSEVAEEIEPAAYDVVDHTPVPFVAEVETSPAILMNDNVPTAKKTSPRWYLALVASLIVSAGVTVAFVHWRDVTRVAKISRQPNPEALDLYLRGRYYWNLRTEEGLTQAVDLFMQSIVNDPHYAAAYTGLADSYILLRQYGHMPNSDAFPRALAAAQQAIALDETSPDAHRSLAFVLKFWNWDMPAAEKEYRSAIELNPHSSQSHHWYATALLSSNRGKEALNEIDIARTLEPQSVSVLADRGVILYATNPKGGVAALQQVERSDPAFVSTHSYLAEIYLGEHKYPEFLSESRIIADLNHNDTVVAIFDHARRTLATRGDQPMLQQLADELAPLTERGSVPAYATARLYSLAGLSAQATKYLHLSCDRREPGFLTFEQDSAFDRIRNSSEFTQLIVRLNALTGSNKQIAGNSRASKPF